MRVARHHVRWAAASSQALDTSGSAHSPLPCPKAQSEAGPGAGKGNLSLSIQQMCKPSPQGDREPWGWMMRSEVLFSSEIGLNLSGFLMHEFLVFKLSKSLNVCGFRGMFLFLSESMCHKWSQKILPLLSALASSGDAVRLVVGQAFC